MNPIFTEADKRKMMAKITEETARLNCRQALLSRTQVATLLGMTAAGVGAILRNPSFPAPIHLQIQANRRWRCGDVLDWIEERRLEFLPK